MHKLLSATVAVLALVGQATAKISWGFCPTPALQSNFDVNQYLGTWYEQARDKSILFQYGDCSQAKYSLRPDNQINVVNSQMNPWTMRSESITGTASCNGA